MRAPAGVLPATLVLVLAGCRSSERNWPFPRTEARDEATILATLADRTSGIESLYAELAMSFETKERSAVCTAVVNYRAPDAIRMSAFKDILIASRSIFEFLLTGNRFITVFEGGNGLEHQEGALEDVDRMQPGFRAMIALREAMFLPGKMQPGAPVRIDRAPGRITLHTVTASGHAVRWELDPDTLGVLSGQVSFDGWEPVTVHYESYRPAGRAFVPERFRLADPAAGIVLEGWLEDLELNPELDPGLFDPADLKPAS